MTFDFETISREFGLGDLTARPQRVTGGYLHKMFRLDTTTGTYAIKLLNPMIMKRPGVLENYKRAERLERVLSEYDIPIVASMEYNGVKIQCRDNQYFYLFEWTDGKALDWHEIKEEHCRTAGKLLARIHKIPWNAAQDTSVSHDFVEGIPQIADRKFSVDWDAYLVLAEKTNSELAEKLAEHRDLLYQAEREYNTTVDRVPEITCITDGDMDCKNVLWKDGKPQIIDLECLDFGNPFLEMFQLALSWAGGVVCRIDPVRVQAYLTAYQSEYGKIDVDWAMLSGVGFSWLDWLEYNTKRALRIECVDEEEQKLGIREAKETIRRIAHYHAVREDVLEYIKEVK